MSSEFHQSEQSSLPDATAVEVPSIGPRLRAAREARGETAHDVASALKFSARQVEALEDERLHDLPGPAFVKGFYRNYGRYLGVDVEPWITARWSKAPAGGVNLTPPTNANGTMPVAGGASGVGKAFGVLVGVLALALALGWYFDGFRLDDQAVTESAEAVAERETPALDVEVFEDDFVPAPLETEASTPADEAAEVPPRLTAITPIVAPPAPRVEPPVAAPPAPVVIESPAARVDAAPEASEAPARPATTVEAAPPAPPPVAPVVVGTGSSRLVFRLRADAWIQVRDADDRSLYAGTSRAGTTRVVQGDPPFWITVGNATAVALEFDGQAVDLSPHMHTAGVARLVLE